jgi:hypothetical protein
VCPHPPLYLRLLESVSGWIARLETAQGEVFWAQSGYATEGEAWRAVERLLHRRRNGVECPVDAAISHLAQRDGVCIAVLRALRDEESVWAELERTQGLDPRTFSAAKDLHEAALIALIAAVGEAL